MRIALMALSLALFACAHGQTAEPSAAQAMTESVPLELPAAFEGQLSEGGSGTLVLLDPARYIFFRRGGVVLAFRHGLWEREGTDAIVLAGAEPGRFHIASSDRLVEEPRPEPRLHEPPPSLSRQPLPALVAGTVVRRHGRIFFESCNRGEAVPMLDATRSIQAALGESETPRYVELLGTGLGDGSALDPPEGADELIGWEIQRIGSEAGCDGFQPGVVAIATGNEPGWKLEIDTRSVRLHRMGQDPIGSPWAPFLWEEGAYRYRADTGDAQWDVTLRPVPCNDTMSDTRYAWQAEVKIDETTMRGCAYLGTEWHLLHGG